MSQELGKIEKMPIESYKKGRKIFFIPVIYGNEGLPEDFLKKLNQYWEQVEKQIIDLSLKLGDVKKIYHELIAVSGEEGNNTLKDLDASGYKVAKACLDKKAQLEALEDIDYLTEYMDWSRCLLVGLQNPKVLEKVYNSYNEVSKKRNEAMSRKIDETLKENEIGLVFLRENHQVQFPTDIQIFYVSPPALDDIKRWLREHEQNIAEKPAEEKPEDKPEKEKK
ncbi:MAG: hypothetical protein PHG35_02470 [Dehalococcoidales bacterium]|nr:hypothetical protein [Dehalococcoidales bacterium]